MFNKLSVKTVQAVHKVTSSRFSDFMADDSLTFKIGGPGKTSEQIRGVPNLPTPGSTPTASKAEPK